jgi:transketolase
MEVRGAVKAALQQSHPVYIRIGKKGEPVVHQSEPVFVIGKAIVVREGTEICLLSSGTMLPVAAEAAARLDHSGKSTRVVSFHTIKPLDEAMLADVFARFALVATIEEHSVSGGLGGAVAEWRADHPEAKARLVRFGTRDEFLHETCEQEEAREYFGLTPDGIAEQVRRHGS